MKRYIKHLALCLTPRRNLELVIIMVVIAIGSRGCGAPEKTHTHTKMQDWVCMR